MIFEIETKTNTRHAVIASIDVAAIADEPGMIEIGRVGLRMAESGTGIPFGALSEGKWVLAEDEAAASFESVDAARIVRGPR